MYLFKKKVKFPGSFNISLFFFGALLLSSVIVAASRTQETRKGKSEIICPAGSINYEGSCWLKNPRENSYAQQNNYCTGRQLRIADSESVIKNSSSLFVMGVLPENQFFWTASSKPCAAGDCKVVLRFSQPEGIREILVPSDEKYNARYPTLCVNSAFATSTYEARMQLP